MALEAMVFPQDFFAYSTSDESLFPFGKGSFVDYQTPIYHHHEFDTFPFPNENIWDIPFYSQMLPDVDNLDAHSPCPVSTKKEKPSDPHAAAAGRRKRQRMRNVKNREEIESQRMTHIAVERNRRRQMNEYLATLRSLMPQSYAQRGDQASIVGGAINYVKELEQQLQSLQVQKKMTTINSDTTEPISPFADLFTFPQYSSSTNSSSTCSDSSGSTNSCYSPISNQNGIIFDSQPGFADVEVTMVESHANLKVSTKKRPKQLVKIVAGLQNMQLIPQHLNMTSAGDRVMYSFSLKVEDESKLTSVDEIAAAVYQMLGRIQEEASFISS